MLLYPCRVVYLHRGYDTADMPPTAPRAAAGGRFLPHHKHPLWAFDGAEFRFRELLTYPFYYEPLAQMLTNPVAAPPPVAPAEVPPAAAAPPEVPPAAAVPPEAESSGDDMDLSSD